MNELAEQPLPPNPSGRTEQKKPKLLHILMQKAMGKTPHVGDPQNGQALWPGDN